MTTKKKLEGRGNGARAPQKNHQVQREFRPKLTIGEAQRQRILAALREKPQTSYDLRCMGCYEVAARISELRNVFGFRIDTERVTLVDRDGYRHPRAARYVLRSEPEGVV